MEDWSKLEGKKIIMLGCNDLNQVQIGVIVGCDPDIGICIADPDDLKNPWWICKGPLAPGVKEWNDTGKEKRREELKCIIKMLQSGYYSWWEDTNNELRIWGKRHNSTNPLSCPFSE